jgi:hypothetical protein
MSQKNINANLKHVTILEEAHHLLPRVSIEVSNESGNIKGKAVEMLSNSIAEMRTYGEGFIIVDQSPNMLDISAIRNTNTKIVLRLSEIEDRENIGKSMALKDEQIDEIPKLEQGVAIVYQNGWEEAVLCKIKKSEIEDKIKRYKYNPPLLEDKLEIERDIILALVATQKKVDYKIDFKKAYKWADTDKKKKILKDIKSKNINLDKFIKYINYIIKGDDLYKKFNKKIRNIIQFFVKKYKLSETKALIITLSIYIENEKMESKKLQLKEKLNSLLEE